MNPRSLAATTIVAAAAASFNAHSVNINRSDVRTAADVCRPALPAYDGQIRARPLAVVNESSSTAFVTCGIGGHDSRKTEAITLVFHSSTPAAGRNIKCTLVTWDITGVATMSEPVYMPGVSNTGLDLPNARLTWNLSSNNGNRYGVGAVSCQLKANTGIRYIQHAYHEDVRD